MRIAVILLLAAGWIAASISQAGAAEKHSPLSWLGFGRDKPRSVQTTNVSRASKTPTVFAKLSGGTKRFVDNTKSLLTPKKPPVEKRSAAVKHRAKRPEPPKQSLFKRWFNPDPPAAPRTIDEWMSLEQIHP